MKIKIVNVDEVKTKTGNTFTAYKAVTKDGKKIDCRFTRSVPTEMQPDQPCYIEVEDGMANVDTHREYPVLWVKSVKAILPFESKNNLSDFFD